ncbi:hypothetical protein [Paraglaciecola arctica]|uniref:hypothetical protein n=1 Tax=Paraglaciecola arctica TaxID=1128911 RepID=UPI001C06D71D|nr:hypothetical protein [Paraglaciecola arctica]
MHLNSISFNYVDLIAEIKTCITDSFCLVAKISTARKPKCSACNIEDLSEYKNNAE